MLVPVIAWKEASESGEQIAFRTGATFHEGKTGRGMRHEDIDQSVTPPGAEPLELRREIDDPLPGGVDLDLGRVHAPQSAVSAYSGAMDAAGRAT